MNPIDFLELATQLVSSGTEAAYRTAIGRSYYAAFHSAALLIKEMGVALPVGPESHQKVRYCLMESGEAMGLRAGNSLQLLRKQRNVADYDLDKSAEFNAKGALQWIERARAILEVLQNCREEPARTRFRDGLRNYAANVLRLSITDS